MKFLLVRFSFYAMLLAGILGSSVVIGHTAERHLSLDPIVFEACNSGLDFIAVDWNDIPGAICYDLTITNLTSGATTTESGLQVSELFLTGLAENDEVEVQVVAKSNVPGCESIAIISCTTAACANFPPLSFNPCEEGSGFITFSWNAIPGISGYVVTNSVDNIPINQTETTFTVTGLAPLEKVTLTVEPIHPISGCSIQPSENCCTTPCPNLPLISALSCADASLDFVFIVWDEVANASGYEVSWSINGGMLTTDTIQNSELLVSNLNPEDEVEISVVAINIDQQCGNSVPASLTCVAAGCPVPSFTDPNLIFCWSPSDGPLQLMIGEVIDDNGNPLMGDVAWLDNSVDAVTGLFTPTDSVTSQTYLLSYEWSYSGLPCVYNNNILVTINIQPTPLLIIDNAIGCVGDPILVTNASLDPQGTSEFDFMDAVVSGNPPDIELVYNTPGIKTISLTITSAQGCSQTVSEVIEIQEPGEILIVCEMVSDTSITFLLKGPDGIGSFNYSINGGPIQFTTETSVTIDSLTSGDDIEIAVSGVLDPPSPCEAFGFAICTASNTDAIDELDHQHLSLYPNPVDETLYIDYSAQRLHGQEMELRLSSIRGEILHVGIQDSKIDVSQLSAGIYLLNLRDKQTGKSYTERIIVY